MQLHNTEIQGFSRLKRFFHHGINYSNHEQNISMTRNPIIGNIPHDILDIIIKENPQNKKNVIQNIQNAYIETSKILYEAQKLLLQAINRFSPSQDQLLDIIFRKINIKDASQDKIYQEKLTTCLIKAEEVLIREFKKIFPNLNNIILSPIGLGTFGDVYKCQFFDINKQKIIEDKVIKIFQSDMSLYTKPYKKIYALLKNYSNQEIIELGKKQGHNYNENFLNNYRKSISKLISDLKNKKTSNQLLKKHGAFAEANITEYIKFMNGHKVTEKDGLLLPDMYVLSHPSFHIAKYIDSPIKAKRPFNFQRLGLEHEDLDINPDNSINNVCIDVGGISRASKNICQKSDMFLTESELSAITEQEQHSVIVGDKENTKILKKIINNNGRYPNQKVDKTRLKEVMNEINEKELI